MLVCQSIQLIVYTVLIITFVRRYLAEKANNRGVTTLPIIIAVLVLLEGVCYIVRVFQIFPIRDKESSIGGFMIANALSCFLYVTAWWIFAIKYH